MHRNYYLFERQVYSLQKKLLSARLISCFTHRKNELVLRLENKDEYLLRIGLQVQTPYILLYPMQNIRDPRTHFFKEIIGNKITNIRIIPFDKLVYLDFKDYTIQCTFFGKVRNIYLLDSHNEVLESFKKQKIQVNQHKFSAQSEEISVDQLLKVNRSTITQSIESFITKKIGGFNKLLAKEICYRSGVSCDKLMNEFEDRHWEIFIEKIAEIQDELKGSDIFLYRCSKKPSVLSLVKLSSISSDYQKLGYEDVNEAWKQFIYQHNQEITTRRLLERNREKIKKRIDYLEKTLKKITDFKKLEENKKISELKGNLLLTFSAEIPKGIDQVILKNIYSAEEEQITIKINPRLSISENAHRYFEKFKNIQEKKSTMMTKRDAYDYELEYWKKIYDQSKNFDTFKEVQKLDQLLIQKKLIQKKKNEKYEDKIDSFSFNRLLLGKKWEVLIGKNAQNNDLLTFKFAHKYDLWLHAQGVSGSHVIIRLLDKNQNPPIEVIRQAASIAAYFSAAKNSSTVPVIYTQVRYVRKPRKAAPGNVLITHEKTIFVKPTKYL